MVKYEANKFRCKVCGKYYHTKQARDGCEVGHREEAE